MSNKKSDAYREVERLINDRAEYLRDNKTESKEERTHVQLALDSLHKLDETCAEYRARGTNSRAAIVSFHVDVESIKELLVCKLKRFDTGVQIDICWNNADKWYELRALGIVIIWSKFYLKTNLNADESEFIDFGRLLLDDFEQ